MKLNLKFNRQEFSGAFGDIGTDLPLLIAMIPAAHLDAASVFTMFGAMQILTGLAYGIPMPMQPLKAMAVIVITQKLGGETLMGAGLAIGLIMLLLSALGLLTWLARVIPFFVVRGIQLGLALSLGSLALKTYIPASDVSGYVLATICFVLVLLLRGNKKFPPALPVIGIGIVTALFWNVDLQTIVNGIGLRLPEFHIPRLEDVVAGLLVLALPQLPLSLSNSVIATEKTLKDLFPERAISVRKIGITYGLINLVNPFFGGVPVCHGCGGLAGHHAFGARTGGSVVIYGMFYLLVGLFFSGAAEEVVQLFPLPVLGVILLFEALSLGTLIQDATDSKRHLFIALMVAFFVIGLPQGYLIGTVAGTLLAYFWKNDSLKNS